MSFEYQKARELMVENQLKPNKIKNNLILDVFKKIPKENFLPDNIKEIPYSDLDIKLLANRGYLKNLQIAQLINHSDIGKNDKILHIGALTGYVTTLLANFCNEVVAIEIDKEMNIILKNNIEKMNLSNIKIVNGSFTEGFKLESPFDIIFIDTPIFDVHDEIINQLNENLGRIIMIKKEKGNLSKATKITKNKESFSYEYLFDVFSNYELFKKEGEFIF